MPRIIHNLLEPIHSHIKKLHLFFFTCTCTYCDCVFVASRHFDFKAVDVQHKAPHPDRLARVSPLIPSCQFKIRKSSIRHCRLSAVASTVGGDHPGSTGALQVKWHAAKRQKVPIASSHTQGLCARLTEVQAVVLLAVLLGTAGSELTVHAVVGAVAEAALLALPVRPESLIRGQLTAIAHTTAVATRDTQAVPQRKTNFTPTTLQTRQRARLLRLVQVGTGQRAGSGALVKMTVLWTGKS